MFPPQALHPLIGHQQSSITRQQLRRAGISLDTIGTVSPLRAERWLAVGLAERGIYPLWGPEVLPGVFPDAVMPEAFLIVECGGRAYHSVEADLADDASREGLLRSAGWHVLRFTATQLRRNLDAVLDTIVAVHHERRSGGLGLPRDWQHLAPGRRLRPPASR